MIAYKVFFKYSPSKTLEPIIGWLANEFTYGDPKIGEVILRADDCGPFHCYLNKAAAEMCSGEIWKVRIKKSKEQSHVWLQPHSKAHKCWGAILADEFELIERVRKQ